VEVIAVREHATAQAEHAIHGSCEARGERLHAAREIAAARSLDDEMHVIVLDRVVREAEATALARSHQVAFQLTYQSHCSQRRQSTPHLRGDMAGMTPRQRRARTVIVARARAAPAARTRASSAPPRSLSQIEIELPTPLSHRRQCDSTL
jgi:hypothetical protein